VEEGDQGKGKKFGEEVIACFPFTAYWVFDTSRTTQKTPRQTILLLRLYLLLRLRVYRAVALQRLSSSSTIDRGDTETRKQKVDLISLHLLFKIRKSRLKWCSNSLFTIAVVLSASQSNEQKYRGVICRWHAICGRVGGRINLLKTS
jgi:hypothetical protein